MQELRPGIAVVTQPTRMEGLVGRWATPKAALFRLRFARQHQQTARLSHPTTNVGEMTNVGGVKNVDRKMSQGRTTQVGDEMRVSQELQAADAAASADEYLHEDVTYQQARQELMRELDLDLPLYQVQQAFLPNFVFDNCMVVVVLGRDGLVANTAKYIGDKPLVAVNPDPRRIDGVLLPFQVSQARAAVLRCLDNRQSSRLASLAEATLNDGQRLLAFNDFFIGRKSHASARYTLQVGGRSEPQSSSGVIVSTGAGSTGWLSSIFNMVEGFGRLENHRQQTRWRLQWDDRRLAWAVREPFRSQVSGADLVAGLLEPPHELVVESLMPEQGVIFSDGVESDFLEFNSGVIARVRVAQQQAQLVTP